MTFARRQNIIRRYRPNGADEAMKKRDRKPISGVIIVVLLLLGMALFITSYPAIRSKVASLALAPQVPPAIGRTPVIMLPRLPMQEIKWFPFSDEYSLKEWEEKLFKGRVDYTVEEVRDASYVRSDSKAAASAMYYKIKLDPRKNPVMSWKWRVEKFPEKTKPENLESEDEHDFAARVYVIFPTAFLLNSKVLEYIWAEKLPVGASGTSPYSKHIKLIVLDSGPAADGEWRFEERDITADYIKMFGKPPERAIGAVAFMSNAEHTLSSAGALFDDIKLGYKDDSAGKGGL